MAFTKSDGTAGSFDENGKPVDNKNNGQSIQGINSKLGSDSATAQDGTDTSANSSIQPVNVPHSNAPSSDNRVKKITAGNKNTDIREGLPAGFNSYKGTFSDAAKKRTDSLGISDVFGANRAGDVGDSDGALAAAPGLARERTLPWDWRWGKPNPPHDMGWGDYVDEWIYRLFMGQPETPTLPGDPAEEMFDPCQGSGVDCYKSDLCHDTGVYCGEIGVIRNIYHGKLGPYSGYWYEAGNSIPVGSDTTLLASHEGEQYYSNDPIGCCNSSGKPESLNKNYTTFMNIKRTYGVANASAEACGNLMTGLVGDRRGWLHELNFVESNDKGLGTYGCMRVKHSTSNSAPFRGIFFEPNDCGSGDGSADLFGCYLGTTYELNKIDSFMVGTPDDPCFCDAWQSGYGEVGAWTETHPWQGWYRLNNREVMINLCDRPKNRFAAAAAVDTPEAWVQCVWTGTCSGVDGPFVMDTGVGYGSDNGGPHGTSSGGGGPQYPTRDASGVLSHCTPKRYLQATSQASAEAINCFKVACTANSIDHLIDNSSLVVTSWDDAQFRCVDQNSHELCEEQYIFTAKGGTSPVLGSGNQAIALLGCCLSTSGGSSECLDLFSLPLSSSPPGPLPCYLVEGTGAWVGYSGGGYDDDKNWYVWDRLWSGDFIGSTGACSGESLEGADCSWVYTLAHFDCVSDDSAAYYTDSVSVPPVTHVGSHPDIDNLQMVGVNTGTSVFFTDISRCSFEVRGVSEPFVDCGTCYTGTSLYDTGLLVFYTGEVAPSTGRNYRIDSASKTGNLYGNSGCGYSYGITYMCSGVEIGPSFTDVPEDAIAPTGVTRNCFGGGGNCTGKCNYVWEKHYVNGQDPNGLQYVQATWLWRLLPPRVKGDTCNCTCSQPNRDGVFNNEVLEGTCT